MIREGIIDEISSINTPTCSKSALELKNIKLIDIIIIKSRRSNEIMIITREILRIVEPRIRILHWGLDFQI